MCIRDRSIAANADRECSNGYYELPEGTRARYVRLVGGALPYGQALRVSGLRVFGVGNGEKPAPAACLLYTSRCV